MTSDYKGLLKVARVFLTWTASTAILAVSGYVHYRQIAESRHTMANLHPTGHTATSVDANCDGLPRPKLEHGCYVIPWEGFKKPDIGGFMHYKLTTVDNSKVPTKQVLDREFPVFPFDKSKVIDPPNVGLRVMWFGHATVLVQMDGINILTDPVFSNRCGPLQPYSGLQRYRPAPCGINELPHIHAVVISHNHYDHLDYASVVQLRDRFGDELRWYVPSGLKHWMTSVAGCQKVVELNWWDEDDGMKNAEGNVIRFVGVPAQHWSQRSLMDANKTLWGGWCVIGPRYRFYFAGDTGYNDGIFKLIGQKYGPFDLAAIPIGAYDPRWFMQCQHVDPEEAFKIHEEVKAFNSIGIHWGTFNMSSEYYMEPRMKIQEYQEAADKKASRQVGQFGFFTLNPGESRDVNGWPR
jgi:N-acyl-phosphatidylethanolamine-hydrolysing phospholipase D